MLTLPELLKASVRVVMSMRPTVRMPIFGRQRAGDQRHVADQARFEDAAEPGDAVGQHDAVDAVLHIGVIVADMQSSRWRRNPAKRRAPATRLSRPLYWCLAAVPNGVVADGVGGGAHGRVEMAAAFIEGLGFRRRLLLRGLCWGGGGRRRRCARRRHTSRFWAFLPSGDGQLGQGDLGRRAPRSGGRRRRGLRSVRWRSCGWRRGRCGVTGFASCAEANL